MKRPLLLTLAFLLVACEQADPQPTPPALPAAIGQAVSRMDFARAPGESPNDLAKAAQASLAAMMRVGAESDTWQRAHSLAQEEIENAEPGIVRSNVEQAMSKLMLTGYLIPGASSDGTAEVALDYAERLVQRGSPEAQTVLDAVQTFEDKWGTDAVRAVALRAADAAESYVRASEPCEECEMPAEARRTLDEAGRSQDVVSLGRLDAAARLRALAG